MIVFSSSIWPISMPGGVFLDITLQNVELDSDSTTLDLVIRGDVFDSQGNDADRCEKTGMNIDHVFYVIKESDLSMSMWAGGSSYDDCPVGEYTARITVKDGSLNTLLSLSDSFTVE